VVDPQPLHDALVDQLKHLVVRDVEDLRILDADARELVDGEEAPVPAARGVPVEELRAALLVAPERVLVADRHVVGNDVEDDAEPCTGELPERVLAAEFLRNGCGIDDVVAVRRPRARPQHRREVQVRHAEALQVRDELLRLAEPELRPQLQAVRAAELLRRAHLPAAAEHDHRS
jgi:hypothetical protein